MHHHYRDASASTRMPSVSYVIEQKSPTVFKTGNSWKNELRLRKYLLNSQPTPNSKSENRAAFLYKSELRNLEMSDMLTGCKFTPRSASGTFPNFRVPTIISTRHRATFQSSDFSTWRSLVSWFDLVFPISQLSSKHQYLDTTGERRFLPVKLPLPVKSADVQAKGM